MLWPIVNSGRSSTFLWLLPALLTKASTLQTGLRSMNHYININSITGPNGPIPDYILDMHPTAPLIRRQGEVNAWDSPDFRAAVKATGKKQMIVAGVTTDVCVSFLTLSLIEAGYEVWTNTAASGTFSTEVRDAANLRMEKAGATTAGTFVIACELMRDWRKTPGALEMLPYFSK